MTEPKQIKTWQNQNFEDSGSGGLGLLTALYQKVQDLNAQLEQQVQERTAQLGQALEFEAMLKRITDKVRDSLDEAQILQTAVRELALGLKAGYCNTSVYNLEQQTILIRYEYENFIPPPERNVWSMADLAEHYAQLLQGECFQFCLDYHALKDQVTILACPIFDNQEFLGDLWLFQAKDYVFDELEMRLLQQVANQCAIAIRQARLYQTSQTQVAALEKLNRLKDDFLSTVSHELRTPVSNMKMAIYMLKAAPTEERRQRYLEILQTECAKEASLINDLLDLQSLEAASYPVFIVESINLQAWLPEIIEPFQSRASQHQQTLQSNLPPDLPPLISDRASLERIFSELLNNACKYTPATGKIALSVCSIPPASNEAMPLMVFTLSNTVEIPEAELPRIFEKFYRVPHADPWKQGGTGLGLALVQRLVERLKGTIHVDSAEGWTTFTLRFPTQGMQEVA